jgi:hypothetical protein
MRRSEAADINAIGALEFPMIVPIAAVIPAKSGYPVIAGLSDNRDVTAYWIIRFRG